MLLRTTVSVFTSVFTVSTLVITAMNYFINNNSTTLTISDI